MIIEINQRKISFRDKCDVLIDDLPAYTAVRKLLTFLPVINLIDNQSLNKRLSVNKCWSLFSAAYDIYFPGNEVLNFRTKSMWKTHYQCQGNANVYDIYGHAGRKYSVYKNNIQIAWWDKNAITVFSGNQYKIVADRDVNVELIIAFCLAIHDWVGDDRDSATITIDVGNIGPQEKEFDMNWVPK